MWILQEFLKYFYTDFFWILYFYVRKLQKKYFLDRINFPYRINLKYLMYTFYNKWKCNKVSQDINKENNLSRSHKI